MATRALTRKKVPVDALYDLGSISPEKPLNVGRNEMCPCGSGLKFKKCCANTPAVDARAEPLTVGGGIKASEYVMNEEEQKQAARIIDEGVKPHARQIVEINVRGQIPVVVFEPWEDAEQALRNYGWKGEPVFPMNARFKHDQSKLDWVTRRWISRTWKEGEPIRFFLAAWNAMLLMNHSPGTGYTTEPGSTDEEKSIWGN